MNKRVERLLSAEEASSTMNKRVKEMAFAIRDLSVLAYANGFTLWHYRAGKARLSDTIVPDFFADAADLLSAGDMMLISAADTCGIRYVAATSDGVMALKALDCDDCTP